MLLSRVAEQLYWAARYVERAENVSRIVSSYTDLVVDLPTGLGVQWESLLAISGGRDEFDLRYSRADEASIIEFIVAERDNPASVVASVAAARDNLRSCREVIPRVAWQVVNDLHRFVSAARNDAVSRRGRARFLEHVIADSQRLNGIWDSVLSHDATYDFLQLGQGIERADMTTRVLGVRAAALMTAEPLADASGEAYDGVQWMGILRSLSALQMFHRNTRSSVSGPGVVGFLLLDRNFPRSVVSCMHRVTEALQRLPMGELLMADVAEVFDVVSMVDARADDGVLLDHATDRIQQALAALHARIIEIYVGSAVSRS